MVHRHVSCNRSRNGGLENHWFAEILAYLGRYLSKDTVLRQKARDTFPRLISDPKDEARRKLRGKTRFVSECHKSLRNLPGSRDIPLP